MLPDTDTAWTIVVTMFLGFTGTGFAWWQGWLESPRRREEREQAAAMAARNAAMADAILGEPEVKDLAGGVISPSRPGLVARTATLEQAVATLVNQQEQIRALAGRVDAVEATQAALIGGTFERGATAALTAVEKAKGDS